MPLTEHEAGMMAQNITDIVKLNRDGGMSQEGLDALTTELVAMTILRFGGREKSQTSHRGVPLNVWHHRLTIYKMLSEKLED